MSKNKRKKKTNKKGFRIHHLLILIIIVYTTITFFNQQNMKKDLTLQKNKLEAEVKELDNEITNLDAQIKQSGTLSFVEKVARDEYGLVKPREIIYIDKNKADENDLLNK
ncbi:MAG TPA: septum formation initiator family protein [Soehngenia sp.]|nr:septum formation initiator family protein [Soehngenia sp.]